MTYTIVTGPHHGQSGACKAKYYQNSTPYNLTSKIPSQYQSSFHNPIIPSMQQPYGVPYGRPPGTYYPTYY